MILFGKKKLPITNFFSDSFIDIHSHLLPGIDDGAKDMDDSIALISKLSSFGIKKFITTPHVFGGVYNNSSATILNKLKAVKEELKKRKMTDISIRAAAEYMLDEQFLDRLKNKDILTLKDNLVLVEVSYFSPPINLFEMIYEIQLQGYKPVLAHPERYNFYHNNFKYYRKLKNAGCLFQLNLLSLTPHYGAKVTKVAEKLLKKNHYDFVGSDTHHFRHLESLTELATQKNFTKIQELLKNNKMFL